jgi:hypothetical protein
VRARVGKVAAKLQGKNVKKHLACIKSAGAGTLDRPFAECLTYDPKFKTNRWVADYTEVDNQCPTPRPEFGYEYYFEGGLVDDTVADDGSRRSLQLADGLDGLRGLLRVRRDAAALRLERAQLDARGRQRIHPAPALLLLTVERSARSPSRTDLRGARRSESRRRTLR